ncbi:MAG: copper resistance protein CopC [Dehalococcoidia bacterium]|nr:copper resistance protein CopC [Dehalococcoidia bacterium]
MLDNVVSPVLRGIRAAALIVLVVGGVFIATRQVAAHADYDHSTPEPNQVVDEAPDRVDVFFTQDLFKQEGRNDLRVLDESNAVASAGAPVVDDDDRTHMYVMLPPSLPPGRYVVEWMTTSDEDEDVDEGAFCFYVATEPTAEQEAACAALAEEEEETVAGTPGETPAAETPQMIEEDEATPTEGAPAAEEDDGDDDGGVPTAALIGGAIGGAAMLAVVIGGAVIWLRRTVG